jgi:hypothetical protein
VQGTADARKIETRFLVAIHGQRHKGTHQPMLTIPNNNGQRETTRCAHHRTRNHSRTIAKDRCGPVRTTTKLGTRKHVYSSNHRRIHKNCTTNTFQWEGREHSNERHDEQHVHIQGPTHRPDRSRIIIRITDAEHPIQFPKH